MLYCVTVNLSGASNKQIPTFFLDADIQGIVSCDHAQRIAMDMFGGPGVEVHACAVVAEFQPKKSDRGGCYSDTANEAEARGATC